MKKILAFEIDKEKFYRFESTQNLISAGRYLHTRDDITLFSTFGMSRENIDVYFNKVKELINAGQLGAAYMVTEEFQKQTNLFPEIDLIYRISARVFFKEGDNLAFDIDPDELDRRVELFKKKEIVSLLSTVPLPNLLSSVKLLRSDSPSFLINQDQVIRKSSIDWLMTMGISSPRIKRG